MKIVAKSAIAKAAEHGLAFRWRSLKRRMGDKWRSIKSSVKRRRYFISVLKDVGCLRFRDRLWIMFTRDLGKVQMEVIARLTKIYEKAFFSIDTARSSVWNVGETVKAAQEMLENEQHPN